MTGVLPEEVVAQGSLFVLLYLRKSLKMELLLALNL